MTLEEILRTRRAVRRYTDEAIDADTVRHCIDLARLAPTSSNMQLWECYHVTDSDTIRRLVPACLDQTAVSTAQQLVVFVTRRDLFRRRAAAALAFERGNVARNSPADRQASSHEALGVVLPARDAFPLRQRLRAARPAAQDARSGRRALPPDHAASLGSRYARGGA